MNVSFSAPTVAVNAFNRTQTLDDLYVSVFVPENTLHWPGNVKKYKVVNENVVDATGAAAVDPATGFFKNGSRSYWSATADGPDVTLGGAAHKLPDPGNAQRPHLSRHECTDDGAGADGHCHGDHFHQCPHGPRADHGRPDAGGPAVLGQGHGRQGREPAEDTSGVRHAMGDPVHSEPAVVIYSGSTSSSGYETVVYVTTNDGYLHAFNATANANGTDASNSGAELWSFIPQELLPDLAAAVRQP